MKQYVVCRVQEYPAVVRSVELGLHDFKERSYLFAIPLFNSFMIS